ncbi:MAG: hypothetical protein KME47_17150 [Nodosilinea sp. WJT8-NPBG4]|jgi:predicted transcriptional regulator|nr:hypothetical protein [Nodosilinea sp. WJT8-NPBG4]
MIALFSIKPEYVQKIFFGDKRYEYRKVIFRSDVSKIVVYCTKPVGMIVGEFSIERILEGNPESIWEETQHFSGIRKQFYNNYFKGRSKVYAINIRDEKLYQEAVNPYTIFRSFTPPQSFRYLNSEEYAKCLVSSLKSCGKIEDGFIL